MGVNSCVSLGVDMCASALQDIYECSI